MVSDRKFSFLCVSVPLCSRNKLYFGKPKTSLSSCIWAWLMPSGSKPMFLAAM